MRKTCTLHMVLLNKQHNMLISSTPMCCLRPPYESSKATRRHQPQGRGYPLQISRVIEQAYVP